MNIRYVPIFLLISLSLSCLFISCTKSNTVNNKIEKNTFSETSGVTKINYGGDYNRSSSYYYKLIEPGTITVSFKIYRNANLIGNMMIPIYKAKEDIDDVNNEVNGTFGFSVSIVDGDESKLRWQLRNDEKIETLITDNIFKDSNDENGFYSAGGEITEDPIVVEGTFLNIIDKEKEEKLEDKTNYEYYYEVTLNIKKDITDSDIED